MFVEGARQTGRTAFYGRFEVLQVETSLLLTGDVPEHDAAPRIRVAALTLGATREHPALSRGFDGAIGTDVTFYALPSALRSAYGVQPGLLPRVLSTSSADRRDGTHVEHAHVAADGPAWPGDDDGLR